MQKKERTGLFKKLFGNAPKKSCCGFELEEIPAVQQNLGEKEQKNEADEERRKRDSSRCCCG